MRIDVRFQIREIERQGPDIKRPWHKETIFSTEPVSRAQIHEVLTATYAVQKPRIRQVMREFEVVRVIP